MVFNRFTRIIGARLLLLVLTLFLLILVLVLNPMPFVLMFLLALAGIQLYSLLKWLNRTNEELAAFISSFQYQDATRTFDLQSLERNFSSLHASFNKMTGVLREARREKEEQMRLNQMILDQVGVGMMMYEQGGKVLFHNQAAADLLEVETFSHLEHIAVPRPGFSDFIGGLREGKPRVLALQRNNGKAAPVSFSKKEFRLGVRNLSLISMNPIQMELEQQEVGSWQKLIRILTHEMMNTLTPVVTLSGNIEKCLDPVRNASQLPDRLKETIDDAARSATLITSRSQSLMHFVEKYRSLSLMPPYKPEAIALKSFLEKQIDFFSHCISRVDIRSEVFPADLQVMIDPVLMSQAIVNLVKNAVEALADTPRGCIRVTAGVIASGWYIAVQDNGPGIAPEHFENVFVPFFTTKKQGSGIGLSLCRQIMSLHQGSIELDSSPGKGCVVKLLF